jgi:DNA (cytosine-5)-methyltransferase 1
MRPAYSIPSMKEIDEISWNGYNAVSTFSGCGGSSLGYKMAGFRVLWASEFIPAAQDTYTANHPGTILDTRDLRTVSPEEILSKTGLQVGDLDLLDGSPPCASFSTAGSISKSWGEVKKYSDTKQRTDDLFFEFIRILRGLSPKVFIAENVSGLVRGKSKGYFLSILQAMKASGYYVTCRILDAQWLGVPQARRRTIFIGVRTDLKKAPQYPTPFPYRYALRDALLLGSKPITEEEYETVKDSVLGTVLSAQWDKLHQGEQSAKYFNCVKAHMDKPCPTICASHGSPGTASTLHPLEKRKFTIRELKAICGFPTDFILTGSFKKQWERLGRAVPPIMMANIARTVRDEILGENGNT